MRRHARYLLISALVVVIAPAQAAAQSYQLLAEFNAPGTPNGPLDMQLKDGDLYGVTQSGAIFKLTPSGTLTTLYQASSLAIFQGLVEDSDGAFRGVLIAADGAPNGAIWRYDVTTGYSLEYVLSTLDGQFPEGDLVRASDGALYGITYGSSTTPSRIFRYQSGLFSNIYSFAASGTLQTTLFQASDGLLYGISRGDGTCGLGTVFRVSLAGVYSKVRDLCADSIGYYAEAPFVELDGLLYGITVQGGPLGHGSLIRLDPTTAVVTPFYALSFGQQSIRHLTVVNGRLYAVGGQSLFEVKPSGEAVVLYDALPTSTPDMAYGFPAAGTEDAVYGLSGPGTFGGGAAFKYTFSLPQSMAPVPAGTNVTVQAVSTPGTPSVSISFGEVEAPGETIVSSSTHPIAGEDVATTGFTVGTPPIYYEVTTTASIAGNITLCFSWVEGQFHNEAEIMLGHFVGDVWTDITTQLDTTTNTVCGNTESLSPFALFEPLPVFLGLFQPVDNPPTRNRAKAGSAIPVKFSLGGDYGLKVFQAGAAASQSVTCGSLSPVDEIEETVTAGKSGLTYDSTTQTYTYVWRTDKQWTGCRQLILRFFDGTQRTAVFEFLK